MMNGMGANTLLLAAGLHRKRNMRSTEEDDYRVSMMLTHHSHEDAQRRFDVVNDQMDAMREEEITKYHIAGDHVRSGIQDRELDALINRAKRNIEREVNYAKLCWYAMFSVVYCTMLVYQGNIATNYSLESSVHNTIINQLTNLNGLAYGTAIFGDRGSIPSKDAFYSWLRTSILERILTQPKCGVSQTF
jgi:hypothetical protein